MPWKVEECGPALVLPATPVGPSLSINKLDTLTHPTHPTHPTHTHTHTHTETCG